MSYNHKPIIMKKNGKRIKFYMINEIEKKKLNLCTLNYKLIISKKENINLFQIWKYGNNGNNRQNLRRV